MHLLNFVRYNKDFLSFSQNKGVYQRLNLFDEQDLRLRGTRPIGANGDPSQVWHCRDTGRCSSDPRGVGTRATSATIRDVRFGRGGTVSFESLRSEFRQISGFLKNSVRKHKTAQTQPRTGGGLRLCTCRRSRSPPCEAVLSLNCL